MRDVLELVVCDVESVTVRARAGHGQQATLTIATRHGELALHLLPRKTSGFRLLDLRERDRRKASRLLRVPFPGTGQATLPAALAGLVLAVGLMLAVGWVEEHAAEGARLLARVSTTVANLIESP